MSKRILRNARLGIKTKQQTSEKRVIENISSPSKQFGLGLTTSTTRWTVDWATWALTRRLVPLPHLST